MNKRIVFFSSLTVMILAAPSLLNASRINPGVSRFQTFNEFEGETQNLANQIETSVGAVHCDGYDSRGNLPNSASSMGKNFVHCGEQFDQEVGKYYLRARYYKPGTGRFWTLDGEEGEPEEPKSLNGYSFCEGDPIDHADPSGNDIGDVLGFIGGFSSLQSAFTIKGAWTIKSGTIWFNVVTDTSVKFSTAKERWRLGAND